MKILISMDKFKYTFDAKKISNLIKYILQNINYTFKIKSIPLSDGGEGFLDVIELANSNELSINKIVRVNNKVNNALFKVIDSYFLFSKTNKTAYIELAKTCGLELISQKKRNPLITSTYGVGEQILLTKKYGAEKIIIGIGGSATNDAGIGMATALNYKFFDKTGCELNPIGENLINITTIENSGLKHEFDKIKIYTLADVENCLYGKNGAAYVYAKQKGANNQEIKYLDQGLKNFNNIILNKSGVNLNKIKGTGAAGGIGAGLKYFLNSKICSGSNFIFDLIKIEEQIKKADLIITGEGKLDNQTMNGKLIFKLSELIKKYDKKFIIICGYSELEKQQIEKLGNPKIISLFDNKVSIAYAKKNSASVLEKKLLEFFGESIR